MHRAAVVELSLALVEGVCSVARSLEQTAYRVREGAAAERIGDVAVGIGINAGLGCKLGVEGVSVGILRGVELGKVNALALQAGKRGGVFLVQHKIIHALELHQNQVLSREQAGHRIVLMRRALIEERVDLRGRLRGVCVGRDRQPRVAQYKLIRPGQREVVGRGGKPLVLIPARLPRVPVQRFGHRCIQARRDQLGQHEKQPKRRADAAARRPFGQRPHAQHAPEHEEQHHQYEPPVDQLAGVAHKVQPLAREQEVGQEQETVENAPHAVLHHRVNCPHRVEHAVQRAPPAARRQQCQRGKQGAEAQRKQIRRCGIKRIIRAAVRSDAQRQIKKPERQHRQQQMEQRPPPLPFCCPCVCMVPSPRR